MYFFFLMFILMYLNTIILISNKNPNKILFKILNKNKYTQIVLFKFFTKLDNT